MSLVDGFKKNDLRALSRLISLVEDRDFKTVPDLQAIFSMPAKASVIGITGPPGAGKSTLLNAFIKQVRASGKTVAVLAVDPVSPFSGGALLGDRIRLSDHFNDGGVYIRSLSTRGKLGGLSLATRQGVMLCDRFGFDFVLIETVGVGQSEVDIRQIADCTAVVLVPEWGDSIQALKAGILEIADVFLVNKADREGAERVELELKNLLHLSGRDDTAVLKTATGDIPTLEAAFGALTDFLSRQKDLIAKRRAQGIQDTAVELLQALVFEEAEAWVKKTLSVSKNPYELIQAFRKDHPAGSLFS